MPDINETREQIQARIAQATQNFNTSKQNYQEEVTDPNGAASASAARSHEWAESDDPITIDGDDNLHYSSKHWAGEADEKVDQYAEYMNEQGRRLDWLLQTLPVVPEDPEIEDIDEAISDQEVAIYLGRHSSPLYSTAQGRVYLSRVPWASKDDAGLHNAESTIFDESLVQIKLMDNRNPATGEPLKHQCSTDTILGEDEYVEKEWAFFWLRCNYLIDKHGVKRITAIEGVTMKNKSGLDVNFSEDKPTGVFGPKFYAVCALDLAKDETSGNWLTNDGTAPNVHFNTPWDDATNIPGTPLYQLWGISDKAFDELDPGRRLELVKHGIYGPTDETWALIDADTTTYGLEYKQALLERNIYTQNETSGEYELTGGYRLNLWSECKLWDPALNDGEGDYRERPYWIHSAYMGGYEGDDTSSMIVSKINTPPYNGVSQNIIVNKYGLRPGGGEGARVLAFGALFDIVKNATKHSQGLHTGICNFDVAALLATNGTAEKGRIFPTSNTSFVVGGTVRLWKNNTSSEYTPGAKSLSNQWGRVIAIENRTFLSDQIDEVTGDYKEITARCLVFDPDSCDEFYVRTTTAGVDALVEQGQQACCYGTMGPAMAGETYVGGANRAGVIGKHDGSVVSLTDNKHAYRVQGTEYCTGHLICCADMISPKGSEGKVITMADGSEYTVKSTDYVYFYAPPHVTRKTGFGWTTTAPYYNATGYIPVGVTPQNSASQWTVNGWMDTVWGVVYPTLTGGSDSQGHRDHFYVISNPAEHNVGCSLGPSAHLGGGANGGSLFVNVGYGLSNAFWYFGSRE